MNCQSENEARSIISQLVVPARWPASCWPETAVRLGRAALQRIFHAIPDVLAKGFAVGLIFVSDAFDFPLKRCGRPRPNRNSIRMLRLDRLGRDRSWAQDALRVIRNRSRLSSAGRAAIASCVTSLPPVEGLPRPKKAKAQ